MTYLLDTNAWIAVLRQKSPEVTARLNSVSPSEIRLCSVVLAELYYGAYRSGPAHEAANLSLIEELCRRFESAPFDDSAALIYGKVRAQLANAGQMIGPNDLLIASIALNIGSVLVTHNTTEFSRIAGLTLDDWQKS